MVCFRVILYFVYNLGLKVMAHNGPSTTIRRYSICPFTGMITEHSTPAALSVVWTRAVKVLALDCKCSCVFLWQILNTALVPSTYPGPPLEWATRIIFSHSRKL